MAWASPSLRQSSFRSNTSPQQGRGIVLYRGGIFKVGEVEKAHNTVRVSDAESGAELEVIQGTGDVAAIAAGAEKFPTRAIVRDGETVMESSGSGATLARFPEALRTVTTHPNGKTWAGASANHLYLIALEG